MPATSRRRLNPISKNWLRASCHSGTAAADQPHVPTVRTSRLLAYGNKQVPIQGLAGRRETLRRLQCGRLRVRCRGPVLHRRVHLLTCVASQTSTAQVAKRAASTTVICITLQSLTASCIGGAASTGAEQLTSASKTLTAAVFKQAWLEQVCPRQRSTHVARRTRR
jgi:hypothetical protein